MNVCIYVCMYVCLAAGHKLNAKRPQLPLLLDSSSNNYKHNIDNDQRAEQSSGGDNSVKITAMACASQLQS